MFKGGGSAKQIAAPILTGKSFDDATAAARNTSSKLTVVKGDSTTCGTTPKDMVCTQSPAAGTQMADNGQIQVQMSSGPGQSPVPDVTNQTQDQATATLKGAGFTVLNTPVYQNSDTVPQDAVISQTPTAGTKADPSTAITLTISQGTGKTAVPNVVGQPVDQATAALVAAGFQVDSSKNVPSTNASQVVGTVASQTPPKAAKNATISLTIYAPPAKVVIPDVSNKTVKEAIAILGKAGFSSWGFNGPHDDNALVVTTTPGPNLPVDPSAPLTITTMAAPPGKGGGTPSIPGLPPIGGGN
jgi:serine/threonine-protein kinase